ncbi:MFS transporter [Puia sp. P3]|uniref:MFS transporter n=1 Tax=Puia sp. P3 TaxID=3423952 RepID=UPI003D66A6B7
MTKKTYITYILVLGLLTALGPFSIDMYLPGFGDIAHSLNTSVATVAPLALQLFHRHLPGTAALRPPPRPLRSQTAPLRRPHTLYHSHHHLHAGPRYPYPHHPAFHTGRRQRAAAVAAMAMVRDLFGPKESAKVFSLLLLVLGASPMIAPTAGSGYIVVSFGWRSIFLVLAILGAVITALTIFVLPESYGADKNFSLKPRPIVKNFISVLREPQFIVFVLVESLAFAGLFAYVSGSPIVFMDIFHVDKKTYGWIFAFLSVAFIGLSQFNSLLLKRYSSQQIIWVALFGQVLVAAVFLAGNIAGWYGLSHTILFIFLFLGCLGFTNPNAAALSLAPFSKNAGSASALLGALQLGIGAIASFGIGAFSNGTANPMIAIMAISSFAALLVLIIGKRSGKLTATTRSTITSPPAH